MMWHSVCFILKILLFWRFCDGIPEYHQDDYDIVHDRIETYNYSKVMLSTVYGRIANYNATQPIKAISFGGTLIKEIRSALYMNFNFLKSVSGTYRTLPFNFTFELCDEYANLGRHNPFGIQTAIQISNFRGCPLLKKEYHLNNWIVEQDKFAPRVPSGKYSVNILSWVDAGEFLFHAAWFGELVPKQTGKKRRKGK